MIKTTKVKIANLNSHLLFKGFVSFVTSLSCAHVHPPDKNQNCLRGPSLPGRGGHPGREENTRLQATLMMSLMMTRQASLSERSNSLDSPESLMLQVKTMVGCSLSQISRSDSESESRGPPLTGAGLGRGFAAALLQRLFGTNPRSHKSATDRVRTGDQRLPLLCHCQLGQDIPNSTVPSRAQGPSHGGAVAAALA